MQDSRWALTRAEQSGRIPSLDLMPTLLVMQPRIQLAFWAASAHWWLMSGFSSTSTAKSFLAGLLSIHSLPSLYLCLRLPQPMCRALHLALLNFVSFAQAHCLSLSGSLWMASRPSGVSTAPLSLVSTMNSLRAHSIPLSVSLMMMDKYL